MSNKFKRQNLDSVKANTSNIVVPYAYPANMAEYMTQREFTPVSITVDKPDYTLERRNKAINDEIALLGIIENHKKDASGGYDVNTDRWYPHVSVEGGEPTIGYGLKLINHANPVARRWANLAKKQGYLTDKEAIAAKQEITESFRDDAKKIYDRRYGNGAFDKLPSGFQAVATDIQYNGGLGNYKNFMAAINKGDIKEAKKQAKRYFNGVELGRNKIITDYLDSYTPYIGKNYGYMFGGAVSRPTLATGGRIAYKHGGIHINPANRGKLTETMKRTGKTKEELAHSKNPLTRKRAIFALNAEKWNHKH